MAELYSFSYTAITRSSASVAHQPMAQIACHLLCAFSTSNGIRFEAYLGAMQVAPWPWILTAAAKRCIEPDDRTAVLVVETVGGEGGLRRNV
jgi:hypothetical protein